MTGNSVQIAEQNINFHKELHNTSIMWSVGGMVHSPDDPTRHVRMWDEVVRDGMEASLVASSLEHSRSGMVVGEEETTPTMCKNRCR